MAEGQEDTERSEDPTQKRLDEALERGDVVKSQEVNTWFVIAGGALCMCAEHKARRTALPTSLSFSEIIRHFRPFASRAGRATA